ncbi:C4-type zinc ribbon domain-containing protein, partial [Desulfovibrio sp. OttesenSCG-928-M16]|nr:C4-type zinc ribbon domain-containing protein [Desulfovibrio sp. OttesenSCG-928-M16]
RERLRHPVIVPVADGVCSGCNIAIPPQNFIELQRASQILSCPNCQRLMFWSEHFASGGDE